MIDFSVAFLGRKNKTDFWLSCSKLVFTVVILAVMFLSLWIMPQPAFAGSWSYVGSANITGSGVQSTSMEIVDGTPYVAFSERNWQTSTDGRAGVVKFDGTNWSFVKSFGSDSNYVT